MQSIKEKIKVRNEKRIPEQLHRLREWARCLSKIVVRTDEQWLLGFLKCCDYDVKKTQKRIIRYYNVRYFEVPELFSGRCPFREDLEILLKKGTYLPLPNPLGASGPRIIFIRYETMTDPLNALELNFMLQDILMMEDDSFCLSGLIYWVDMGKLSNDVAKQMTPVYLSKMATVCQFGCPVKIEKWIITNDAFGIEPIFKSLQNLVDKKLRPRLQYFDVERTKTEFTKYISKEYFPEEYGGNNGSLKQLAVYWEDKVKSYNEWFEEDKSFGFVLKKRVKFDKQD